MTPEERKLEKLQKLIETANDDFVESEDFSTVIEAVMVVVREIEARLSTKLTTGDNDLDAKISEISKELRQTEAGLEDLIFNAKQSLAVDVKTQLLKIFDEISRVEQLIPNATDLSGVEQKITDLASKIPTIPDPLTSQQIRDSLESLKGNERLDKSAIHGLDEWLETNISKTGGKPVTVFGARGTHLYIDGVKKGLVNTLNFAAGNGMTLAYSKENGLDTLTFVSTGGGGSGGGTLAKQLVSGIIDGSNLVFTVPTAFVGKSIIILDSQTFVQDLDFTISGTTITYITAPASDHIAANHYLICGGSLEAAAWAFDQTPTGTVNGSNTVFTLPASPLQVVVYSDGVRAIPGTDYNISGATIIFVSLHQPFNSLSVDYLS